ncbi:YopX family protein [Facklamia hominis]
MIPKFRAWDKYDEEIVEYIDLALACHDDIYDLNSLFESNRYEFMQSTGLFDKNGVEIFEGDIIKGYGLSDEIYVLVKEDFYYRFESIKDDGTENNFINPIMFSIHAKRGRYEVIGNIYENKELLEGE